MKPYYQDDHATIYHGDCLKVLPTLSGVGQVLTSPPYNKGMRERGKQTWCALKDGYNIHTDDMAHADYVKWQHDVLNACWATLTDDGAIYYQHKPIVRGNEGVFPFELIPAGVPCRQIITWDRGSGFNRNPTHYVPRYEWVMVLAKEAFRINTRSVDDLWQITPTPDPDHPAPFPLSLAVRAIGTTDAELIVDPYLGSGTTLVAAKSLGRKAIGIEIDEAYCEIAARRLAQEVLPL
jgi:site-specific DNA-methyltransferase (adenine-specific)